MKILSILVLLVLLSCEKDSEPVCDQYFVAESRDSSGGSFTKFFYNTDRLLSSMVSDKPSGISSYRFTYENKRLKEVDGVGFHFHQEFQYDDQGRVIATVRYNQNHVVTDSLALEYDAQDHIVKFSFYEETYEVNNLRLDSYAVASYIGENTTQLKSYRADPPGSQSDFVLSSTFNYRYDNKHKPFPEELYTFELSFGNIMSRNNVISLEVIPTTGETSINTTEFGYNSGGYPVQLKTNGGYSASYTYSCDPPME